MATPLADRLEIQPIGRGEINAFSGEKLDAFGVESTADLAKITPGLTYTYTYGYSVIYIRGVGTDA
ncbi:MAG: hypothetical protein VXW11_06235, partial [Pseudomonadota bacterium]|nr:hypothetical protein [Pseudomonadota bacterium]